MLACCVFRHDNRYVTCLSGAACVCILPSDVLFIDFDTMQIYWSAKTTAPNVPPGDAFLRKLHSIKQKNACRLYGVACYSTDVYWFVFDGLEMLTKNRTPRQQSGLLTVVKSLHARESPCPFDESVSVQEGVTTRIYKFKVP